MVFQRVNCFGGRFGRGAENYIVGCFAVERGFGLHDTARVGLRSADTNACVSDRAAMQAIKDERCGHGEIAGAAVEFVEPEFRVFWKQRQPSFGEQFIFGQRGRHDAREKIFRCNHALATRALCYELGIKGRRDQTPFGSGIGVREAAAKRTAHADRIMRDMAYDHAEQSAKRVIDH